MDKEIKVGRRLYPTDKDKVFEMMKPGDYFKLSSNPIEFIIQTPNGLVCSIRNHAVIEHEDGTITVSPSIVVNGVKYENQFIMVNEENAHWHGYLEHGVWREI